jgi:hypothetical protein
VRAAVCVIVTCRGPAIAAVDCELLERPTRELRPWRIAHVLEELRIAAPKR